MSAPTIPVKAQRPDPYSNIKFQVLIDAQRVAGFRKMTASKKNTEVVICRTCGDPTSHERKLPGRSKYQPSTLEQGLTDDSVFEAWANLVNNLKATARYLSKTSARTKPQSISLRSHAPTRNSHSQTRVRCSASGNENVTKVACSDKGLVQLLGQVRRHDHGTIVFFHLLQEIGYFAVGITVVGILDLRIAAGIVPGYRNSCAII